jgi:hypothetical protein
MRTKATFGIIRSSRALRVGAVAALVASSLAMGAGPIAARTANPVKITGHSLSQGSNVEWALQIERKQATASAAMRQAGVGPSLAGNSTPAGR